MSSVIIKETVSLMLFIIHESTHIYMYAHRVKAKKEMDYKTNQSRFFIQDTN